MQTAKKGENSVITITKQQKYKCTSFAETLRFKRVPAPKCFKSQKFLIINEAMTPMLMLSLWFCFYCCYGAGCGQFNKN